MKGDFCMMQAEGSFLHRNSLFVVHGLIINWSIIMRFYSSSTQGEGEPTAAQNDKTPTTTPLPAVGSPCDPQPVYFYYFNNYCNQFLYLSNQLSQELVLNNSLITLRTASAPTDSLAQDQLKMDLEVKTTDSNKNTS
jgi:hypothetical protein